MTADQPGTPTRLRNAALAYQGLTLAWTGGWAQFAPRGFYDHFPGLGVWVAGDGPYNEHLIRDIGGLDLSLAALCLLARVAPGWITARAVGLAALISAAPHLTYHLLHLNTLPDVTSRVGSLLGLTGAVIAPLLLCARQGPPPDSPGRSQNP